MVVVGKQEIGVALCGGTLRSKMNDSVDSRRLVRFDQIEKLLRTEKIFEAQSPQIPPFLGVAEEIDQQQVLNAPRIQLSDRISTDESCRAGHYDEIAGWHGFRGPLLERIFEESGRSCSWWNAPRPCPPRQPAHRWIQQPHAH